MFDGGLPVCLVVKEKVRQRGLIDASAAYSVKANVETGIGAQAPLPLRGDRGCMEKLEGSALAAPYTGVSTLATSSFELGNSLSFQLRGSSWHCMPPALIANVIWAGTSARDGSKSDSAPPAS
jgi:hypothetical protein